jgi:hypothetical protein
MGPLKTYFQSQTQELQMANLELLQLQIVELDLGAAAVALHLILQLE